MYSRGPVYVQPFAPKKESVMLTVPTALVDNDYELFPEGAFMGVLSGAAQKEFDWGTILNVSLAKTSPLDEGGAETNGRTFTGRISLSHDGVSLFDITSVEGATFPLRKAAGLLAGLAEAVGAVERTNGSISLDLEDFVEALTGGVYEDQAVLFRVSHNSWETKDSAGEVVRDGSGSPVINTRDEFFQIGAAG